MHITHATRRPHCCSTTVALLCHHFCFTWYADGGETLFWSRATPIGIRQQQGMSEFQEVKVHLGAPHTLRSLGFHHGRSSPQLHCCCTAASSLLHCSCTAAAPLLHRRFTAPARLLHRRCTAASLLLHRCCAAAPLLHCCFTAAAPLLHL